MNNKNLRPFKLFALKNFPFIEADFDAITNYELLCKIVEYLNNVIASQNQVTEQVQTLTNNFNDLLDYVNNYFDNLDVQEEINNKLDDMVEQGTLQEIIADYLNSKAIFAFDTVTDMVSSTNLIDGSYAKTLGYHEKNDEGSALYLIREITNDDVIDNMQIISLNRDDLIAEFINEDGIVRPEQFGAYGDDTHDDSTILNAIIQIAITKGYKIVGNKTYKTTAPIVIVTDKLELTLETIDYTGVENAIYVKGHENIINVNSILTTGTGIYVACDIDTLSYRNVFNINEIKSSKNGIVLYSDSWGIFENHFNFMHIEVSDDSYNGIYLYSSKETEKASYVNQNVFYGGRVDGANYAIYADGSNGQINEILAYDISGEGCINGMYLNKVTDSSFENWRLEELTNEAGHLYMKLVGDSRNNNFRFNRYCPIEYVDRTELTNPIHSPNTIYSNIRDTRQGSYCGNGMLFYGSSLLHIITPSLNKAIALSGDKTLGENEVGFFFNVSSTAVTPTIKLNGMYGDNGINEFYVYKRNDTTSITITNYDESSSIVITRTGINKVIFMGGLFLVQ